MRAGNVLERIRTALVLRPESPAAPSLERQQELFRRRFGRLIEERVNPGLAERDAEGQPLPRAVFEEASRLGLTGLSLPRSAGGSGIDIAAWGLALEELAYLCEDAGFPLVVSLYASVAGAICQSGRRDLVERYVRPLTEGKRFVSFAYSEERDAFSFHSSAEPDGDGFVLNGRKVIVTGGMLADAYMTYARAPSGDLVVLLVERDMPGVDVLPADTMGMRTAGLASLRFDAVHVPGDNVLEPSDGLGHVQRFLNTRRLITACGALGYMRAITEKLLELLSDTVRYRMSLTDMQAVQAKLGRLYVSLETCRAACHGALQRFAAGAADPTWDPPTSAVKFYVTEQAVALGQTILHLAGGRGYEKAHPFERYVRNISGLIAGAGSQDILEVDLGVWLVSAWERKRKLEATK